MVTASCARAPIRGACRATRPAADLPPAQHETPGRGRALAFRGGDMCCWVPRHEADEERVSLPATPYDRRGTRCPRTPTARVRSRTAVACSGQRRAQVAELGRRVAVQHDQAVTPARE